jgi:hypothetical protein
MLIGPLKEKSQKLKIKVNVDHAGLSPQQEHCNLSSFSKDNRLVFLNNNSLIAADLKETKDAMEDGHQAPSTTSRPTESPLRVPIPTPLEIKLARPKEEPTRSPDTPATVDAMDFQAKSTTPPSQLPLMPPTGAPTDPECSTTALPESTTPFSSSES